ncbi:GIN domain-containing protein [Microbulbifer rhizosphaerae]|uniref:Putative auto-transporter adhesin head GIN domain-containing protein n=1 Tax=Microbulbifer rhizosphaerae TaxID=1562603 RepID=A0A7W4WBR0_9GAMM|nr:DUF2807 domain-containing protein [Microbulbifer rhizosphaerae]MBB3060773.1 hypothetical protein [Microbulbifer rhizosphaerae]
MITKSYLAAPLAALLLLAATLAGGIRAEEAPSRQFPLSGFTRVVLEGSSSLELVQGDGFEVIATGSEEAMPHVKAELRGESLELSVEPERKFFFGVISVSDESSVRFRVTLPVVDAVVVTGSGEVRADTLESENLELRVTGSGTLKVNKVAAESLSASLTGSGDLLLGTVLAVRGETSIRGSGDMRLDSFAGETLAAKITGSGDMVVGGRVGELDISLMGSGDFVGRGLQAKSAGGSIMGSGDVVLRRPGRDSFSVMGSGDVALVE